MALAAHASMGHHMGWWYLAQPCMHAWPAPHCCAVLCVLPRWAQALITSAQFLHKELPVRLAHRVTQLESLPYGLSAKKDIIKVRSPNPPGSTLCNDFVSAHAT